jgi:oxygen-dependent protoporphyrinogen oxidase
VRRHFGDEVLNTIAAPLLRGIFGGDVNKLSVRAVMAPFVAMEREHGSLIAALQKNSAANEQAPLFTTLASGLGSLVDRMVASVPQKWVHLGTEVLGISRMNDRWMLETSAGTEHADILVLATPVHISRALLTPVDLRAAELMEMEASSAVVVGLGFADVSNFPVPEGFGFLVPTEARRLLMACTFMDQKFSGRVPENGRLLRAFFGGEAAERLMRCGNDEIVSLARQELARILGPLPQPSIAVVRRWPLSLPQYAVGHLERMAELESRVAAIGSLWLLGNGYRGVGLPDLIRDGRAAARSMVGSVTPVIG